MSGNDFYQDASFDTKAWTLGTTLLANSLDATRVTLVGFGSGYARSCGRSAPYAVQIDRTSISLVHRRPSPVALRNSPAGSRYDNKHFGRVRWRFGKFEGGVDGKGGLRTPAGCPAAGCVSSSSGSGPWPAAPAPALRRSR